MLGTMSVVFWVRSVSRFSVGSETVARGTSAYQKRQLPSYFHPLGAFKQHSTWPRQVPRTIWTTNRVLFFTAFTASLTYYLGVGDAARFRKWWSHAPQPQYASKVQMEKVDRLGYVVLASETDMVEGHPRAETLS